MAYAKESVCWPASRPAGRLAPLGYKADVQNAGCATSRRLTSWCRSRCSTMVFTILLEACILIAYANFLQAKPPTISPEAGESTAQNAEKSSEESWSWLGRRSPKPQKPAASSTKTGQPQATEETAEMRLRRRLEVCDRLKLIALETNDIRLEQAASELEDLVWQWYWEAQRRRNGSASPGVNSRTPASMPLRSEKAGPSAAAKQDISSDRAHLTSPGQPAQRSDSSRSAPVGPPVHERLDRIDVHTIRGSAPGSAPVVVELGPEGRLGSRSSEEVRP
ncbi:hypothetical protein HRbin36_00396 [bacterium HR36]|nr:hypothetical protein HRbin36_00396 [bacterium HR36]